MEHGKTPAPAHEIRLNNVEAMRQLAKLRTEQQRLYDRVKRKPRLLLSERAMWLTEILLNIDALGVAIEHLESLTTNGGKT